MHVVSLFFSALVLWQLCRLLYGRHSLWQWALWGLALACYAWFTYLASMTFIALGAMIVVEWVRRMLRKEQRPRAHRLVAGVALIIGQKRRDKAAATSTGAELPGEFTTASEDENREDYE